MATEIEKRVLGLLSMIEVPRNAPDLIEEMGPEAVNVACEAALGTYVGLRPKTRTNAAAVVGRMQSQQARETLLLLITDPSDDVAIRALRAARRRAEPELLERAALVLERPEANPLVVVEAVHALRAAPAAGDARQALDRYRGMAESEMPAHRRHAAVQRVLGQEDV